MDGVVQNGRRPNARDQATLTAKDPLKQPWPWSDRRKSPARSPWSTAPWASCTEGAPPAGRPAGPGPPGPGPGPG